MRKRVCVFCGSSSGSQPLYADVAVQLAQVIVGHGAGVVYGGGGIGLMGTVATAALKAGGEVIGVIPEFLSAKEIALTGLTELRIVGTMHERKAVMAELATAFIAMPGGFGTFDELCEILTWAQLGLHRKPCGILNVNGFYDPLLAMFDNAVEQQFLKPAHRAMVISDSDPARLVDRVLHYEPPAPDGKWISPSQV